MKIRDYQCAPQAATTEEKLAGHEVVFPDAYHEAGKYAELVRLMSRDFSFFVVPFDNTAEAENVGAIVESGDMKSVPRVRELVFQEYRQLLTLPDYDLEKERLAAALGVLPLLRGKPVMFELAGPYTFMSAFVDSTDVLKASRKDVETETAVFQYLLRNQLRLAKAASERGAAIFSLVDPASGVSIVGPKIFQRVIELYALPLISGILSETDACLFLCPKLTFALWDLGLAEKIFVRLETPAKHHEAVAGLMGKYRIFGDRCYKLNNLTRQIPVIEMKRPS
ncbi:uroporphyrinogen decarboxylase/cobalamine-independent methonine synthase family protein [Jonquetella anthropi]|uniref:uroporphyrinogen decarboxylase n=1 Tax=Jonquetella anthropi TaxID=428712 RepID=UPI0001B9150E|nr:uroporphyrinogen decarboxylase [Jonquetella anthropi]EEX47705.1 hypothetical protein GCWU000246_01844 [Jonquetella anthropi E3_33 E1]